MSAHRSVIQVVQSCPADKVEEGRACRGVGKKIIWLAVTGDRPYTSAEAQNFSVEFNKNGVPIDTHCKDAHDGVVECKVKANATIGRDYDDSVATESCHLDPRIYVQ